MVGSVVPSPALARDSLSSILRAITAWLRAGGNNAFRTGCSWLSLDIRYIPDVVICELGHLVSLLLSFLEPKDVPQVEARCREASQPV